MEKWRGKCPLCNGQGCEINKIVGNENDWDRCGIVVTCNEGMQAEIHESVWACADKEEVHKRFNMIYVFLSDNPVKKTHEFEKMYRFFYEESSIGEVPEDVCKVNVAELIKNYPLSFLDKAEMALLNLSKKYPRIGDEILVGKDLTYVLYAGYSDWDFDMGEIEGMLSSLNDLGYLSKADGDPIYRISAQGWIKIAEMEKEKDVLNQGFIAMQFGEKTKSIRQAFKEAISECRYVPRVIDEKEHNHQIVPEILYEISKSKFVVVDITFPNYGAYYEAGYAEALGKEVIICCKDTEFQKVHFDIAQKSAVVWKDEDDLRKRLYRRIEATVGLNI